MSPQIKNSDFALYRFFNVPSNLCKDLLKSAVEAVYKLNIIKLDVLVSS
jgi:hypothetical protein